MKTKTQKPDPEEVGTPLFLAYGALNQYVDQDEPVDMCAMAEARIAVRDALELENKLKDLLEAAKAEDHFQRRGYTKKAIRQFINDDWEHPLWKHYLKTGGVGNWIREKRRAAIAKAEGNP